MHTDDSTKKGACITSLVFQIQVIDIMKTIVMSAHMICRNHIAQGIQEGIQDIIDEGGLFLERWHDDMEEKDPEFIHDIPPRDDLHLGKL